MMSNTNKNDIAWSTVKYTPPQKQPATQQTKPQYAGNFGGWFGNVFMRSAQHIEELAQLAIGVILLILPVLGIEMKQMTQSFVSAISDLVAGGFDFASYGNDIL